MSLASVKYQNDGVLVAPTPAGFSDHCKVQSQSAIFKTLGVAALWCQEVEKYAEVSLQSFCGVNIYAISDTVFNASYLFAIPSFMSNLKKFTEVVLKDLTKSVQELIANPWEKASEFLLAVAKVAVAAAKCFCNVIDVMKWIGKLGVVLPGASLIGHIKEGLAVVIYGHGLTTKSISKMGEMQAEGENLDAHLTQEEKDVHHALTNKAMADVALDISNIIAYGIGTCLYVCGVSQAPLLELVKLAFSSLALVSAIAGSYFDQVASDSKAAVLNQRVTLELV